MSRGRSPAEAKTRVGLPELKTRHNRTKQKICGHDGAKVKRSHHNTRQDTVYYCIVEKPSGKATAGLQHIAAGQSREFAVMAKPKCHFRETKHRG